MLKMKPTCERCAADSAADAARAYICSFECTLCAACMLTLGSCSNCGGELVSRPKRAMALLEKFPPVA